MKQLLLFFIFISIIFSTKSQSVNDTITPPTGMYMESIPSIPTALTATVRPYTEFRSAAMLGWHANQTQVFISTRFGNTNQIHQVSTTMGNRRQLTFEADAPREFSFQPNQARYFFFSRDSGGNEFTQLYRYDLETGSALRLTHASNVVHNQITWNKNGQSFLYMATIPGSADREVYWMNANNNLDKKLIKRLSGSGWSIADWNPETKQILMNRSVSINESSIWAMDELTGNLVKRMPHEQERVIYQALDFSEDGQSIYLLTNQQTEFSYLAKMNLKTNVIEKLTDGKSGEVQTVDFNSNQTLAAIVINEEGYAKLYLMDLKMKKMEIIPSVSVGTIGKIQWHKKNSDLLAITHGNYLSANDVYVHDAKTKKTMRWTESELGGMPMQGIQAPELIRWNSFDQRMISGFLYRANKSFSGKRPVIIQIHGGPEGQSLPIFAGKNNYYTQELGVHLVFPNVRGSTGYGKTFADLDNGFNRENSVKDIGALLDWIATQPDMDASRVMVTGGSYGGYMTLASAVYYSDRLRCALDVVGISHFKTFLEKTEPYRKDLRRVEYGDERDSSMAAFFEKISPLNRTAEIKIPLCIVQGKNDPRVPFTESEQMVRKVRANGNTPVWYLLSDNEGHGFAKKTNQDFQFFMTILFVKQFLLDNKK